MEPLRSCPKVNGPSTAWRRPCNFATRGYPGGLRFPAPPPWVRFCSGLRDSGHGAYVPYVVGRQTWLAIETPIYTGKIGAGDRRGAPCGIASWVSTGIVPEVCSCASGIGEIAPASRCRWSTTRPRQKVTFRSGKAADTALSATIDLHNGWAGRDPSGRSEPNAGVLSQCGGLGVAAGGDRAEPCFWRYWCSCWRRVGRGRCGLWVSGLASCGISRCTTR